MTDFRLSAAGDPASDFEPGNGALVRTDHTLENVSNTGFGGGRPADRFGTLGARTDLDLSHGGQMQMTCGIEGAGTDTPSYLKITTYVSTDDQVSSEDMRILGITGGTFPGLSISPTTSDSFQNDFAPGDHSLISTITWGDGTPDATPVDNTIVQQITFTPPTVDLAITGTDGTDLLGVTRMEAGNFLTGSGNDVVTDFDVLEDMLCFQINDGTTYDPLADTTQTAGGALIPEADGSSILLQGVGMADLTIEHFVFEDSIYVYAG